MHLFTKRINLLMEGLGASSVDIARCAGCSPSNISRLRSGSRTPGPYGSTTSRFLEGIYGYAAGRNALPLLCSLYGGNAGQDKEHILDELRNWLYQESEPQESRLPAHASSAPSFCDFGNRLNAVMNLLSLSNIRLSRAVSLDPSYISRFRNGVRSPLSNTELTNSICRELWKYAREQNQYTELSGLTGIAPPDLSGTHGEALLHRWLCDFCPRSDTFERLLESIDSFSIRSVLPLPDPFVAAPPEICACSDTLYVGIEGLRRAVLRFLGNAAREGGGELWLYSDQSMDWMIGEKNFLLCWMSLMSACVKNHVRIKIVHNADREADEMMEAIRSWLPLYMSGMIEPYTCRSQCGDRFSHTIFLRPGREAVFSSHLRGCEQEGWYDYITDIQRLNMLFSEYGALLRQSVPLTRIFVSNEEWLLSEYSRSERPGCIYSLLSSLSPATMPESLLRQMLDRHGVAGSLRHQLLTGFDFCRKRLLQALAQGEVHEILPLPPGEVLFKGHAALNHGITLCDAEIFYTAEDFGEHVRAVLQLMEAYPNYHCHILPEAAFENMQIVWRREQVTVIRSNSPLVAFTFSHPLMVHSFEEYFSRLLSHYSSDREDVRRRLSACLSDCGEAS